MLAGSALLLTTPGSTRGGHFRAVSLPSSGPHGQPMVRRERRLAGSRHRGWRPARDRRRLALRLIARRPSRFQPGGWLGGAIVGTLHTFFPSLTRDRVVSGRLQPLTFLLWSAGVGSLAIGYGAGEEPLVLAGWRCCYWLRPAFRESRRLGGRRPGRADPAGPAGRLRPGLPAAGVASPCLAALSIPGPAGGQGSGRPAVLLVVGWIGLTVAGSMLHLISVVRRERPRAGRAEKGLVADRAVSWLAVAGVVLLSAARIADRTS